MSGYHAATVTRCDSRANFGACPCCGYSAAGEPFDAYPCSCYSATAGHSYEGCSRLSNTVAHAKAFNDKLVALRTGVSPALLFFQEPGDETKTMAKLAERILDRANAYAQSFAKDGITHTLATM